ncbi:MAG: hypothetical protein KC417_17985, partial [Myxococcales bacterium]|nr:hypothetical protein [Myxococcales bacterium]
VGLVLVDGRTLRVVPARDDRAQLLRIYDAMLEVAATVDEDLTELDAPALERLVGEYLQRQDGIDFAQPGGGWNVGAMCEHVLALIDRDASRWPHATSRESAMLRQYCRAFGIPLPYRTTSAPGEKIAGVLGALKQIAAGERSPSQITVLSDMDDTVDTGALRTTLTLLRAHGHSMSCLLPAPPAAQQLMDAAQTANADGAAKAWARVETERLRRVTEVIRRLGAHAASMRATHRTDVATGHARDSAAA